MASFLAGLPIILVVALFLGRAGPIVAGGVGLASTVAVTLGAQRLSLPALTEAALGGAWLAFQVIIVMAAGLFFSLAREQRREPAAGPGTSLFAETFLLGPFAECATGFGLGYVLAFSVMRARGIAVLPAALFGMFSQMLVPWGALAIGSKVGAHLGGMAPSDLGLASAEVTGLVLIGHLLCFELLHRRVGLPRHWRQTLEDGLWLAFLTLALIVTSRLVDLELAGLVASGVVLALRYLRDARPTMPSVLRLLLANADYVCLIAILLAVRVVPPIAGPAGDLLRLAPLEGLQPVPLLVNPATWLAALGLLRLLAERRWNALSGLLHLTATRVWRPIVTSILFIVLASIYTRSDLAVTLADGATEVLGKSVVALVPLASAGAGFLTSSNVSSNGLLMPIVTNLASRAGADLLWLAGIQNVIGSTFTMFSPPRLGLGVALTAGQTTERELLARAAPIAVVTLAIGIVAALLA